jgi:uncharacterized protein
MAKHPVAGRVKTRLAAVLGPVLASDLQRAFVLDLAERLVDLDAAVTWAYWPPSAPFAALLPGVRCRPQRGRDLGERLAAAIADELDAGAPAVLAIGADAPHLPADRLREAALALAGGADVVLGPADDGGYYLVGLRRAAPTLFAGIDWGGSRVLGTTLVRAAASGLRVHLLPRDFDVDRPADLARLRAVLARGDLRLPRTAAVLDRCPLRP